MKRSPFKRKPRKAGDNEAHLRWLRLQPCCLCQSLKRSQGTMTEAHHLIMTGRGTRKTPDAWAIPLCGMHHVELHNFTGYFQTFNKTERAAWQVQMSRTYRPKQTTETVGDPWSEIF